MRNYVLVVLDTSDMVQDMSEMEEKYQIHYKDSIMSKDSIQMSKTSTH